VPLRTPTLPDGQQKPLELQLPLQHGVPALQSLPFGMHIGVVVEVEVVLVEVVLVGVVVGAAVVVVVGLSHGPRWSPWPRWPSTALLGTSLVCSAGVPGLWQMVTFCCWARAREGISAAMALPAKSFSAPRRVIDPSASALASSSKERLVVCWLTCCPHSPRGGPLERVMNSIRNGLGMRETEIAREPSRP
jgi:hypothetical protein